MSKLFEYYLVDGKGRSYKVDSDHVVTVSSLPVSQRYTPDGWQEKSVQWGRNVRWPGVFRSFTTSFRFLKDGAYILRYLYYGTKGIQSECNLVILKQNTRTGVYEDYYVGALDFSQKDDQPDWFEVNVMERGLPELLNAYDDTVYEIQIDVPEALPVKMNGITLKAGASYAIQEGEAANGSSLIGCLFINSEGTFRDITFNTTYSFISGDDIPPVAPDSGDYVIRNDGPTQTFTLHFKYTVSWKFLGFHDVIFTKSNGSTFVSQEFVYRSPRGEGLTVDVDFTESVTLEQGQRLFISAASVANNDRYLYQPGGTLGIKMDYRYRETTVKCLRASYVFQQLTSKITSSRYQAASSLLDTEAFDYVMTCGDAIRGIAGAKIKTSLNDFITSYNTRFNCGLGIEGGKAILEKERYYFRDNVIINLGEVAKLRSKPAADRLFNAIKIGWPNQTYDGVNGRDEFNTTHLYTSSITRVQKTLDLTSVYRADCYGIEDLRINLADKNTTDSDSDNDVFIVNIASDGAGGYILNRPAFDNITGLISPSTVFNILLSPKRCLLEHGYSLHCGLDKQDDTYLVFQTTDKNADLSTTLNGVTIKESANVLVGALSPALSYPEELEFDCEVPVNVKEVIEADPFGQVGLLWEGKPLYGHIYEVGQQPAMNQPQTWKLLASKNTDMTHLIR